MDWEHPTYETMRWSREAGESTMTTVPKPLYPAEFYDDHLSDYENDPENEERPDRADFMPEFPEGTATGWCMYETTSEGTPISPVFETPEELAHWLADNGASTFASMTTTYENWLRMIKVGWAHSATLRGDGAMESGVESIAKELG
jgi:hypothetical protein